MSERVTQPSQDLPVELPEIAVDRSAEVPVGVQLAWSLRSRIGDGRLRPGQRLPGVRELARAAGVNVNTARAVYGRLDREGLIDTQQGSGTFVRGAGANRSAVAEIAAGAADAAREHGVNPRQVAEALYVAAGSPAVPEDPEAARRELLRGEIRALDRVLIGLEGEHPDSVPRASSSRRRGPALLSVSDLEEVRSGLVARLTAIYESLDAAGAEPATRPGREGSEASPRAAKAPRGRGKGDRAGTQRPATAGA